jgi:trehalose 6-phosphate phosphatase
MSDDAAHAPGNLADTAVVAACLEVLQQRPAALVTDIDGTISPIAPTPFEAVVHDEALQALERLSQQLEAVAVVSGRAPVDGAGMVGLEQLIYVGNHGLERIVRGTPWTHPVAEAARPAIAAALDEIQAGVLAAGDAPWLIIENKGVTGTVHYRLAEDPEAAANLVNTLAAVAAERHGLRVAPGRMIVELRPALALNKGTAIRDLVTELGLRGVVFFGDDVTDVDGFVALRALRDEGLATTLSVGVLAAETPEIVAESVDLAVHGVAACAATLLAVAAQLPMSPEDTA